jgi:hypothetical protein
MKSLVRTLLFLFVIAVALFCFFMAYADYSAKSKHASWPKVEATVSGAQIDRNPKGWHCPDVKVNHSSGSSVVTATIRFPDPVCTPTEQAAKEKMLGYVVGQQVSIYYDPAKPTTAIANSLGLGLMFYFGIIFGPVFLVLAFKLRKGK